MSNKSPHHDPVSSALPIRRGRGRPRDLQKREAILAAASALFFERGILATTMDSVAARAGVSKMTVYAHFAHKPALLAAVFNRTHERFHLPELANGEDLKTSVEYLNEFGEQLVSFLTRPDLIKSARMMAESAEEHPDLAAAFYAAGPAKMLNKVTGFLRSLGKQKLVAIEDPELAAEQLIAAWLGLSQLRQSLGVANPHSKEEISHRVRRVTREMMRAWAL
jgi:TetR/AcrR family transcriptional regulator, mexJK operon transcriptional repressor